VTIAFVTWLWVRLNWAVGGNFFLTCLFASPMLSTANLHWLARPHVFSWIFMLGLLWYFESRESDFHFRAAHAIVLLLGAALWTNVHASFLFAPMLAMIYAIGHALRPLIWNLDVRLEFKMARWYLTAVVFTLLGSFLNPYGYKLHQHLIEYLMNGDLLARVGTQHGEIVAPAAPHCVEIDEITSRFLPGNHPPIRTQNRSLPCLKGPRLNPAHHEFVPGDVRGPDAIDPGEDDLALLSGFGQDRVVFDRHSIHLFAAGFVQEQRFRSHEARPHHSAGSEHRQSDHSVSVNDLEQVQLYRVR